MRIGPSRRVEMSHLAREHYLHDVSMVDLARSTGMSRFRVSRLLAEARELGILRITVDSSESLSPAELVELRNRYGLRQVRCTDTLDTPREQRAALGAAAAKYLEQEVRPGEVLGFASGRTLGAISPHLETLPSCDVVQLTGLAGPPGTTAADLVRTVCAVSGGAPSTLYVPLVASDAAAAETFGRQAGVEQTFERMRTVTRAMLSVGSWEPPASQLLAAVGPDEAEDLIASGVRADLAAHLFDEEGRRIDALDERTLAIPFEVLKQIPEIAVVAGGQAKRGALMAVLRAGLATALITDRTTARHLLEAD